MFGIICSLGGLSEDLNEQREDLQTVQTGLTDVGTKVTVVEGKVDHNTQVCIEA